MKIYTPGGEWIARIGRHGWNDGELSWPWGVAVGGDGAIYVGDAGFEFARIQKFVY